MLASAAPRESGRDNPVLAREVWLLGGVLALLVGVAGWLSPAFLGAGNLGNLAVQAAPLCLAVLGQMLVILARGLDLSVGSLMATVAVAATAFETTSNAMTLPICAATLALAAAVGWANGWLVVRRGVSPFLATLAMMIVLQGARFAYTKGAPSGELPPALRLLGTGTLVGVPVSLLLVAAVSVALVLLLHRTTFGRRIYVTGTNPRAAALVGIDAGAVTIACYVLGALLSGLAGLVLIGYVGTVDNWVGRGYELDSIVAAVIGGVVLGGGAGSVLGALLGALILVVLFNLVLLLGLPVELQLVIKGLVILLAAAVHATRMPR
ncbi:ABC transporter permease [Aquabacterium humicola]|uniref:ABC transporter permease n=1 Tax=Aquabacterium humicola TaxID=3237377 RepID=UPI002543A4BB|nr:ABC transporter permease [Rubrivivax pictus]